MSNLMQELEEILAKHFSGNIHIIDDSHLHVGHNHGGGSHYTLHIIDDKFVGLSRLERHRLIYDILQQHLSSNKIHALAMKLYTPYEYFNDK
jgi:BolA protein